MKPGGRSSDREAAIKILGQVLGERRALDALEEMGVALDRREWVLDLTAGTLRWWGRLGWIMDQQCENKKPTGWLRRALALGIYQLLAHDRVHPGAVVNETVELVKKHDGAKPAQFVNAVLRKTTQHIESWKKWDIRGQAQVPVAEEAAWASVPEWYWRKLVKDHGREWALSFAEKAMERPQVWLRLRPGAETRLTEQEALEQGPWQGVWSCKGAVTELKGFSEGEWLVQDLASQYLVREVSRLMREQIGSEGAVRALDMCAAPGGKSVGMLWEGFDVTASDRAGGRLKLLQSTVDRVSRVPGCAERLKVVSADDLEQAAESTYDLVWVDAPCSGSGIIRRHPDVRWLHEEKALVALTGQQALLTRRAWERVRSGGFLMYSVCSVFRDEGWTAVEKALAESCGGAESLKASVRGEWLLGPHLEPYGDGFYGVLLKKG